MATNSNGTSNVKGLDRTVRVTYPKTSKELKQLVAGMKMIGWAIAAASCTHFMDKAVDEFDKVTAPVTKKKPTARKTEKKIESKEELDK